MREGERVFDRMVREADEGHARAMAHYPWGQLMVKGGVCERCRMQEPEVANGRTLCDHCAHMVSEAERIRRMDQYKAAQRDVRVARTRRLFGHGGPW